MPTAQIVFAIADNVAANYSHQRYCIINNNGEVIIKANANGEYIWGTTATILNIPAQHSVSQNGDWTVFNFGTDYALSTRKVHKTISATSPFGSLYFVSYSFNAPNIYGSIIYADVNPVTGNGLWIGHYCEIKNITDVRCYLSSATSMHGVEMYVQETVIGKLKQHSVSQAPVEVAKTSGSTSYESFKVDLPTTKMGCLICVYNNRPLCSTVFPISHFIKYNTNASNCVDCYYVSDISLHATAYYQN